MYICHYRFLTGSGGIELPVAALIIGLTEAATMGDARAAKVIIDLIGEEDSQGESGVEIIDDL